MNVRIEKKQLGKKYKMLINPVKSRIEKNHKIQNENCPKKQQKQ